MYPIIYVRGYAMTEAERDDTTADPFCGFNIGSTVFRATADKTGLPDKYFFESPLIRLVTEFGYKHVYQDGADILDPNWEPPRDAQGNKTQGIPAKSIIILRYYDDGSGLLGDGKSRNIKVYAQKLNDLIEKVMQLVEANGSLKVPFKCYVAAHSMGGLIVRTLLQNSAGPNNKANVKEGKYSGDVCSSIERFFTFATPHNGIEMAGFNVPGWLSTEEMNTFNREKMADFLNMKAIYKKYGRVDFIPESAIASRKVFCMVGTNRNDYEVAHGAVRAFVGHGSDGLVKIENASLWGIDDKLKVTKPVATAYTFRSHSGFFGIVNSEEAYQNLVRFLFGDVRVDIWVDINDVKLPVDLVGQADVEAVYQFELLAAPRARRWYLTRRTSVEDSPACRTHAELTGAKDNPNGASVYLSSVFLANHARLDPTNPYLSYGMMFAVKVPDYTVKKRFWPNEHYEGANLFYGNLVFQIAPPKNQDAGDGWTITAQWTDGVEKNRIIPPQNFTTADGQMTIPFSSNSTPGISGRIRLMVSAWSA